MSKPIRKRSKVFCRVESRLSDAFLFLQTNNYPGFWSLDDLAKALVVQVLDAGGCTLGYVWGEWVADSVLSFHACTKQGHTLPLFKSDLLDQLLQMAFWVGADEVVTSVEGQPGEARLERLLRRLNFTETHGDFGRDKCFTLDTWRYHGFCSLEAADQTPE